jgi:hypothetical protein
MIFGESLLLRKLILGIQAQVRGKSLTPLFPNEHTLKILETELKRSEDF